MLLRVYFFIAIIPGISQCFRTSRIIRSAVHHEIPEYDKVKDEHDATWNDWHDEHDSGYLLKKYGGYQKGHDVSSHAARNEAEKHGVKSAASAGKHMAAVAEGGTSKHADRASSLGKEVKAKTFGFFDYQYKQPEYHVEQFYSDEKHGRKFGANRLHHALKDHESDSQEASGWGKHGKGYHNDVHGIDAHEHDGKHFDNWANTFHNRYEHSNKKDQSKGHDAERKHYHYDFVPHHEHHGWSPNGHSSFGHEDKHGQIWWSRPEHHDGWGHDWGHKWN